MRNVLGMLILPRKKKWTACSGDFTYSQAGILDMSEWSGWGPMNLFFKLNIFNYEEQALK